MRIDDGKQNYKQEQEQEPEIEKINLLAIVI